MKKFITFILGITLVYSCSTSEDGNGNSTTTAVPVTPSNLTGTVASSTQINLSWTDNSTNETGFKIERKTGTGTYAVVGTTGTDINTFNDTGLTPNTTYTYRVYSYNAGGNSPTYSNELILTTSFLPTVSTKTMSNIGKVYAVSGVNIINNGGAVIISSGVCWSTNSNPTVDLNTKTINGSGNITGLNTSTTYYVRAYATNSGGTGYGNQISFVTQNSIDTILPNITIGTQIWQTTDLSVTTYRDGTPIPTVAGNSAWLNLTTGAYSEGNFERRLYNWYTVAGVHDSNPSTPNKILAPQGWHIPTDAEWTTLINYLGGASIAGGKMKNTTLWDSPNTGATNESGFSGLPVGYRSSSSGVWGFTGEIAGWWSKEPNGSVIGRSLSYSSSYIFLVNDSSSAGYSIRCIRD